jgi:hypothetical protein
MPRRSREGGVQKMASAPADKALAVVAASMKMAVALLE